MGRFSEADFGREELPERCIIYAGAYLPQRKNWVRSVFDEWNRVKGTWVKYTFATKEGKEYLLVYNVYGGAVTLELLQLLKDGNVKKVFFVGSLGGKDLPIGTIVVPTRVVDKAGIVSVDTPHMQTVEPEEKYLKKLREVLRDLRIDCFEGKIASVPCVLHNINHIKELVEKDSSIVGVELETSTFYYYSQKAGFENYALLYVSDNKKYGIIGQAQYVQEVRKNALRTITRVATEILK
jgi:purine-nucleoside phosphorylase